MNLSIKNIRLNRRIFRYIWSDWVDLLGGVWMKTVMISNRCIINDWYVRLRSIILFDLILLILNKVSKRSYFVVLARYLCFSLIIFLRIIFLYELFKEIILDELIYLLRGMSDQLIIRFVYSLISSVVNQLDWWVYWIRKWITMTDFLFISLFQIIIFLKLTW